MKSLSERQNRFVRQYGELPDWNSRFQYLIHCGSALDPCCPPHLIPFRIHNCQSRIYFRARIRDGLLRVDGWSSSAVMSGIVAVCMELFNGLPADELDRTPIDFHLRCRLVENMTPMRSDVLREIIHRITVLSLPSPKSQLCP
jgi:cysteine desulfuration protein SufE